MKRKIIPNRYYLEQMKVLCKIFDNPTEDTLNEFLKDIDIFSVQVVVTAEGILIYVFYRR